MDTNDIDKLLRDKLGDFKEVPDEKVWNSIEASLDKRQKKRRAIPLWWSLGGAAAAIAVLLLVINTGDPESQEPVITDTPEQQVPAIQGSEGSRELFDQGKDDQDQEVLAGSSENTAVAGSATQTTTDVVFTGDKEETLPTTPKESIVSEGEIISKQTQIGQPVAGQEPNDTKLQDPVAQVEESGSGIPVNQPAVADNSDYDKAKTTETIANEKTGVTETTVESDDLAVTVGDGEEEGKKSIYDAIAEAEMLADDEKDQGKWSFGPSIAPVYYNAIGEGSPIHSNFSGNSKSGTVNLSYGITVAYNIGSRLKLRSGLHKVDYGYNTDDISFSSSLSSSTNNIIQNIDYAATSRNLVVQSNADSKGQENAALANDIAAQNPARSGRMVQEMSYLELPLEMNYTVIDRRLGLDLIGGFSSMLLTNNGITLESDGNAMEVGEAKNLNTLNFSTNFGLGVRYKASDRIQLNVEPTLRFHLNTFTNTAGSFSPYSIGVYSGLSYRF